MDKCPYCSAETRPGDNFCLNCGNRLVPSTPSPQQAQPLYGGDATLPATDDWESPVSESSSPQGNEWRGDEHQMPIEKTTMDPPVSPKDSSASPSSSAPVAQAILDKVEHPARLILRTDTGEVLQEYTLEKSETSIGRAPTSDILLSKDKLTSRRHATVNYDNGKYVILDERSANGTFVNGQQLEEMTPRTLQDGDHIGIGEHELVFKAFASASPGVDIESMPTITVNPPDFGDITFRTREDELISTSANDDFSTRSMNGGDSASSAGVLPEPVAPPASNNVPPESVPKVKEPPEPVVPVPPTASESSSEVTFSRLTNLPQPALPDVAPLMAALATLDGQVSSLQEQLNATQESMRNHEADISQISNQLREGVRRVSERMDSTIADVARNREQLEWTQLIQLMEDVMNNPRDIEYVTRLARKARELNKVFQIHQNVLNTLAECTSLLRSLLGEDK